MGGRYDLLYGDIGPGQLLEDKIVNSGLLQVDLWQFDGDRSQFAHRIDQFLVLENIIDFLLEIRTDNDIGFKNALGHGKERLPIASDSSKDLRYVERQGAGILERVVKKVRTNDKAFGAVGVSLDCPSRIIWVRR